MNVLIIEDEGLSARELIQLIRAVDPGINIAATLESVEAMLNHESGLKALGGSNDMRELRKDEVRGGRARLALNIFRLMAKSGTAIPSTMPSSSAART